VAESSSPLRALFAVEKGTTFNNHRPSQRTQEGREGTPPCKTISAYNSPTAATTRPNLDATNHGSAVNTPSAISAHSKGEPKDTMLEDKVESRVQASEMAARNFNAKPLSANHRSGVEQERRGQSNKRQLHKVLGYRDLAS
jgi:hypothetical protein